MNARKHFKLSPFILLIWVLVMIGQMPISILTSLIKLLRQVKDLKFRKRSFRKPQTLIVFNQKKRRLVKAPKFRLPTLKLPNLNPFHLRSKEPVHYLKLGHFLKAPALPRLPRLVKRKRGRPYHGNLVAFLLRKFKNKLVRFLRKIFPKPLRIALMVTVCLIVLFMYSLKLISLSYQLPSPKKLSDTNGPLTTEFYDRNGKLLYRLYEGKNRTLTEINSLPPYLIDATVAIEDRNFWSHSGVDILAVGRALIADAQKKEIQGASTITQQLIKNTLLTPEQTWQRKLKEIVLSFWTERLFTKPEILQMYFNEVAYGGPAWGIEAASQTYFGKSAHDLTLAEASYLAGLPASPTNYSPYGAHPELGKQRQKEVLKRMVADGYINQKQADEAGMQPLNIRTPITQIRAPHFVMYVRSLLAQKYGEKVVSQGGLKVITSLDLNTQQMAEQVVAEETAKLEPLRVTNAAAMIEDPKTGQILAMVGSKNYFDSNGGNFNVALAERQPGSSIKPITYATGFKQGYSPGTILLDARVAFKNAWETYAPVNYDGHFHGPVPIRTALGSSYNIPAVKMLAIVGIPSMLQTAHEMGITTLNEPDRYGLSLTLGGGEVKLIDMMTVYDTFSQLGIRHDPQPILKVADGSGVVLEDHSQGDEGVRALDPGVAYLIDDILSDNNARTPAFGPNSLLYLPGHTVAVKTGTTDSKRDNWTFGFTPKVTVGVWVGNNDNTPMDPSLTSGVTGAAPIWNRLMTNLISKEPNLAWQRPANVVGGSVDGHSDLVVNGLPAKSLVGQKILIKDEQGVQKATITFTDPFSTFTSDSTGEIVQNP